MSVRNAITVIFFTKCIFAFCTHRSVAASQNDHLTVHKPILYDHSNWFQDKATIIWSHN